MQSIQMTEQENLNTVLLILKCRISLNIYGTKEHKIGHKHRARM